jgi:hypothetical protein
MVPPRYCIWYRSFLVVSGRPSRVGVHHRGVFDVQCSKNCSSRSRSRSSKNGHVISTHLPWQGAESPDRTLSRSDHHHRCIIIHWSSKLLSPSLSASARAFEYGSEGSNTVTGGRCLEYPVRFRFFFFFFFWFVFGHCGRDVSCCTCEIT